MFEWRYGLFGHNYRIAMLSTLYPIVLGIIIQSSKTIGQFWHAYINKSKKPKIVMLKMDILLFSIDYRVVSFFKRYLTSNEIIPESLKSLGEF